MFLSNWVFWTTKIETNEKFNLNARVLIKVKSSNIWWIEAIDNIN